jgi:hypothetical protein
MDTRSKDSIRNTEQLVKAQGLEIAALKEDIEVLTRLVRDIKRSVVRKYGDKPNES